ncbi:hypothetical protein ILYODFUR_018443 [Ilyodon furcidens]|uniref:Uncharacterized protein n=1 Tax=Ilyodon furcidens TaxID=33524 RepID=A0ABV0T957_9TELE
MTPQFFRRLRGLKGCFVATDVGPVAVCRECACLTAEVCLNTFRCGYLGCRWSVYPVGAERRGGGDVKHSEPGKVGVGAEVKTEPCSGIHSYIHSVKCMACIVVVSAAEHPGNQLNALKHEIFL